METKYPTLWQAFKIGLLIIWAVATVAIWKYDFKPEYATWECSGYGDNGVQIWTAKCKAISITVQSDKIVEDVSITNQPIKK